MIELIDVSKVFDSIVALQSVTLAIRDGMTTVLIGCIPAGHRQVRRFGLGEQVRLPYSRSYRRISSMPASTFS